MEQDGWMDGRRRRTDETGNRKEESRFPRFLNVCLSTLADSSGLRTCPTSVAVKWVWPNAGKMDKLAFPELRRKIPFLYLGVGRYWQMLLF